MGIVTKIIPQIVPIMIAAKRNQIVYVTTLEAPRAYFASSSSLRRSSGVFEVEGPAGDDPGGPSSKRGLSGPSNRG